MPQIPSTIISHIESTYAPDVIILHGSRARGTAAANSDWDFFLVSKVKTPDTTELIDGQKVDVDVFSGPLDERLVSEWCHILRPGNVVVIKDSADGIGRQFVEKAERRYAEGRKLSNLEKNNRKTRMLGYLRKIKRADDEGVFFLYLGFYYEMAIKFWFELLHNAYQPPIYEALSHLRTEDRPYAEFLAILSGEYPRAEKVRACEKICDRLAIITS